MGLFGSKKSGGSATDVASAIQNEKQKADIIVNAIDDAVILIDAKNVIKTFNPAAAQLTGWSQEEAHDIDYRSVVRFSDNKGTEIAEVEHPFYQVFTQKKVLRNNELNIMRRDNAQMGVDVSVTPIIDAEGKVSGAVAVMRNVDEQRKQDRQRADFISTASHEMRTPVAAIEGYLALALNDKVTQIDEKARSYLEKAHASTNHLGQLFQDLLTSAKAEDGRLTSHPVNIELSEFVEKLVEDLKFSAEKKGLSLEMLKGGSGGGLTTVSPLLYAHADPDRLREVITNIFDNAVKYTESGKITIGVTGDKNVVQISIADTGPGIPKADIPHLFQKFYRVDNSATRTIGGTGLGLFICRKIVELYNGKIWVESEEGKGSTFYINLPRIDSARAQLEASQPASQKSNTPQPGATIAAPQQQVT